MVNCIVEMFGFALEESGLNRVTIELEKGSHLGDLIGRLRIKLPSLEGKVIVRGENRLVDRCTFNIDGLFYFDDMDIEIQEDCHIRLLTLATGG
ncbi:hypothetical protein ACFLUG_02285 [Chloroflexota bacterium]